MIRIESALLVIATNPDEINTNIAFTVRELNEHIPIQKNTELLLIGSYEAEEKFFQWIEG